MPGSTLRAGFQNYGYRPSRATDHSFFNEIFLQLRTFMPHSILGMSHTSHTQCNHSSRDELSFPDVIKPLSMDMSPLLFINLFKYGYHQGHPPWVLLSPLEAFISMSDSRGHPSWIPLKPLKYFLNIGLSFISFHHPFRIFLKYEVFLRKFPMIT